jgi:hypothetical protein
MSSPHTRAVIRRSNFEMGRVDRHFIAQPRRPATFSPPTCNGNVSVTDGGHRVAAVH